ncbi:Major facilitator, sugar transporter-like [Dillenia turbinata]|uniref:Major facilitator, sugar transporter-like n=1 Tax=Dillenia turbinata TaxID=194707 RepID=A0AAN8UEY9_9MAGN
MDRENNAGVLASPLLVESDVGRSSSNGELMTVLPSSLSGSATFVVIFSTFVAVCGSFVFGCAVGYSSPTESGIMNDLDLSSAEYSVFGWILTIGAMIGAVISGKMADLVGRRAVSDFLAHEATLYTWDFRHIMHCGVACNSILKGRWSLDLGRLLIGCGIGLISYVVPTYIAEITPKDLRGGFAAVHQFLIVLGSALTYVIGTIVSWRVLALIGIIPCLTQFLGLFFVPESSRWLVKIGREKQFAAVLRHLRGETADISDEAAEIRVNIYLHPFKSTQKPFSNNQKQVIWSCFRSTCSFSHCRSWANGAATIWRGERDCAYASSIFESAGFSATFGTIAIAIVQIPMNIVGMLLIDRFGRKPLLMVSAAGSCLGSLLVDLHSCLRFSLAFIILDFNKWTTVDPVLVLIGILVYNFSGPLGTAGIPWIIMSEVFLFLMENRNVLTMIKTQVQASVTDISCKYKGCSRKPCDFDQLVLFLDCFIHFEFLIDWSSAGTFFIFTCTCGLTVLFVAMLVPETKGRTLEEIQASLNQILPTRHN